MITGTGWVGEAGLGAHPSLVAGIEKVGDAVLVTHAGLDASAEYITANTCSTTTGHMAWTPLHN